MSGLIAAAYVAGLQEGGVSAAIKHFVGNDQEHERMGEDSVIAPRALREIYLRPFQIALKKSKPQAFMTAYNKLNGTHCSENEWLLEELLRKEWGFDGLVMSDWYGTYSISESINAGLNLEMPGATRWRPNGLVTHLIKAHKIDPRQLDKVAGGVLRWVQKLAKKNEELVYSPPGKEKTRTEDQAEDAKLLRRLAGESIVLLKNELNVLPIREPKKIAVIGPNAKAKVLTGGGSAQLRSAWSSTPWQGLSDNAPEGVELSYSLGCHSDKFLPILDDSFTCPDGSPGFQLSHFPITSSGDKAEEPVHVETWDSSDMFLADFTAPGLTKEYFTQLDAVWTPVEDGEYEFGVVVTGKGWFWINGELVIDASREDERSTSFFNLGTKEIKGRTRATKNKVSCSTDVTLSRKRIDIACHRDMTFASSTTPGHTQSTTLTLPSQVPVCVLATSRLSPLRLSSLTPSLSLHPQTSPCSLSGLTRAGNQKDTTVLTFLYRWTQTSSSMPLRKRTPTRLLSFRRVLPFQCRGSTK